MKKYIFSLLLLLVSMQGWAVLNERDLKQSLSVLHMELRNAYQQQQQIVQRYQQSNQQQHQKIVESMQKSNQVSLMLFSQKDDYIFDLTYACQEATALYREFSKKRLPYKQISDQLTSEIRRYSELITSLELLPPSLKKSAEDSLLEKINEKEGDVTLDLDSIGQIHRKNCLTYARALRNNMLTLQKLIGKDSANYAFTEAQLLRLNNYAVKRYHDIQQSIFKGGNGNFFTILAHLPRYLTYAKIDCKNKYSTMANHHKVRSEWRGSVVLGFVAFVLFYLLLSIIISGGIIRLAFRKWNRIQNDEWMRKKTCVLITGGVMLFALSIMIAHLSLTHNFYLMASKLIEEYSWLLAAIFTSLLIRLNGKQIKSGMLIYLPIILMGLVIIIMRIVFIPTVLTNLLLPPITLLFTLWQWREIRRNNHNIPRSDMFYTWISFAVMIISCVAAWMGYPLLSVEAFIWWLFQLTAIQAITSVYCLLEIYEDSVLRRKLERQKSPIKDRVEAAKKGDFITTTWLFDFIYKALVPAAGVFSVLYCIFLAADVLDLAQACIGIFFSNFLNLEGVIQISLFKLVVIAGFFFIFRYLAYAGKSFFRHFRLSLVKKGRKEREIRTNEVNLTLGYNLITFVIWGTFLIFVTIILKIPKSGLSIVTAGLATGIGFAMKDLLNNFFYGVSLMTGRLRVGDWIECDGVLGKVENISYQSTQIITTDDAVMSFLNETLFSKNFKNLTRNHSYELITIPVGVAYGTNVARVRDLLVSALNNLQLKDKYGRNVMDTARGAKVLISNFGDNSVDLVVSVRILVAEKIAFQGKAKEVIYETLTKNNIEIPFPQRDIYIKQMPLPDKAEELSEK